MAFTKVTIPTDKIKAGFDKVNDLIDDLLSTSNGLGASQIGIEDSAGNTTNANVETALAEIYPQLHAIIQSYEVDALHTYGGGTSFTKTTIDTALTAIGTSTKQTLLLRPGTWVISAAADWSAYTNVTFKIVPGAVISGAFTVTFPSDPDAGRYQIFASNVNVLGIRTPKPEWFGAKGDGSNDDAPAFQRALNSFAATGGTLDLAAKTYRLTTASGNSDATSQGIIGIDPLTTGLSFAIKGNGTILISATKTTTLANIDMIFFRAAGNLEVSGIHFIYDGGPSTKLQKALHWGAGSNYGINVHDCIFTDFYQSIFSDSVATTNENTARVVNNQFFLSTGIDGIFNGTPGQVSQAIFFNGAYFVNVSSNYYNGCVTTAGVTQWGDGLVLSFARGNVISNNTIVNYENEGIGVGRNTDYTEHSGNTIIGNILKGTMPTATGIRLNAPNSVISGNTIVDAQAGIMVWIEDGGDYTGYMNNSVTVANNIIVMKMNYVSSRSTGITLYGQDIICNSNQVIWPIANTGYGVTDSFGITTHGYKSKLSDNVIINRGGLGLVFAGGQTGTFVAGEYIVGQTSGAICYLYSVGNDYVGLLPYQGHPNNNSFAEFLLSETVISSGGATGQITSFSYPIAKVYGIQTICGPVILDGNRTFNLAGGIYVAYSAATKNGPIEIISHSSEKDSNYIVCDPAFSTLPDPGLRFIQKHQSVSFKSGGITWYRILEAITEMNGVLTITQDNKFVGKWMISYVVGATTAGVITLIQQSTRDTNYVDAIRIGTITGQVIGLDISMVAGAETLVFQLDFETASSNNFLLMDVSAGITLKTPDVGVAAPGTDLISWP